MNIMQTELENMLLVLQNKNVSMLFDKYLDKIYTICFTLKIKIKKHFHEIISDQLQVILLKHYRGGDEGGVT